MTITDAERRRTGMNAIRCKHCGTVAISTHRHHMAYCDCGKVAADGGSAYKRRVYPAGNPEDHFEEIEETP